MVSILGTKKRKGFVLSLFLISLFLIPGLVSASGYREYSPIGDSPSLSGGSGSVWTPPVLRDGVIDPVTDMFTNWGEGNLGINIAKYIFFLILFVVIYGIADMMPFLTGKNNLQIAFSILVSFLATAYITPAEIYVMLTSYTAMGMVIGSVIPFLVLFFFSIKSIEKGGPAVLMQYWVWLAFTVWMIYKTIMFYQEGVGAALWVHFSLTLIAVGMVLFNGQIKKLIFKHERKAVLDNAFEEIEKENVLRKQDQKRYETLKDRLKG